MSPARVTTAGWRLGTRLFVSQSMAHLASILTAGIVALIVAPPLFHTHLVEAGHPANSPEIPHIEAAFTSAGLVSLSIAFVVALALALAVSWYVTKRIRVPLDTLTNSARRMMGGDYSTRITVSGSGPELATLADTFNEMAERLDTVEDTRRRLLSDLAHEMRTPVATLNAHLEALTDGVTEWDDTTRMILIAQSERLARLAQDIDDVSRAEEGRISLDLEFQPLTGLIIDAVEQVRRNYAEKGVALTHRVETADVLVDAQRIAQILGNLLSNALRHTPPGGRVTVTAGRDRGRTVAIHVTDSGEGITPEQLPHVFERFYRGDTARDRDKGGSGIGLTIARALAEAHGGSLSAASAGIGKGSTFTLTVPYVSSHTGASGDTGRVPT